ncbi:hypothetical protein KHC23_22930 [Ancylobacter dichloromethanicus]|uniref:Uncharacterized protein n=1 Tax=Ancylobacter dichloromethanicus TaxID=518825 RepID=A0A9W6JFP8_9HYPH|nr:hypothetical protein [Ancylobacter dichloromethanicus]MBS7556489.1 hypothetical protein [Ancylobacter dichloromethanicus]GLK74708.1 hypothetical protein GCM10017643_48270 [Ancylobacter dichloromethanicus]
MTPDLDELTLRLKIGGWRFLLHADCRDEGLWFYRSELDPRIQLVRRVRRRGRSGSCDQFSFGDAEIDVENPTSLLVSVDAPRSFATLRDLVVALIAHDRELDQERAWQAAAPKSTEVQP